MEYLTPEDYEIAEKNGISKENAHQRFYAYCWSKERTLNQPIDPSAAKRGLWGKYKDVSKISKHTFYNRIATGWTPERAAKTPPNYHRNYNPEHIKTAKANGIRYETFVARVRKWGWTPEEAMTTPVRTEFRRKEIKR